MKGVAKSKSNTAPTNVTMMDDEDDGGFKYNQQAMLENQKEFHG